MDSLPVPWRETWYPLLNLTIWSSCGRVVVKLEKRGSRRETASMVKMVKLLYYLGRNYIFSLNR